MKRGLISIFYMSICTILSAVASRADDELPKRPAFDRYQGMLDRSPFAVASAVVLPAATPNFAKDLYLANAARSSEGDMVTIASNADRNFKKYLTTKAPVDGFDIANIEWSDKVGATKVTISKDGQFATLTFNQALIATPLPNAPSSVPAQPIPVPPVTFPKPAQMPVFSTPKPHVRGVIQRNPPAPAPTPNFNPPPPDE